MNGSFHATKSLVPSRAASMPTMPLGEQFAAGLLDIEFARDDALDFLVDQVMPAVREFAARGDIDHQTDLLSGYFLELLSLGAPTPGGLGSGLYALYGCVHWKPVGSHEQAGSTLSVRNGESCSSGPRRTASARFRERAAHQHGAARLTAMPRPEVARSMR